MKLSLVWLRRDLRLEDHAALYHALQSGHPVLPVFIFDTGILSRLQDVTDARVTFIHDSLSHLQAQLQAIGSSLVVRHGRPVEVWRELVDAYDVAGVYVNRDYEPMALQRDQEVEALLRDRGIEWHDFKDHVIFDGNEVMKEDPDQSGRGAKPYTVFTPYRNKWMARLAGGDYFLRSYPAERYFSQFHRTVPLRMPSLEEIGFRRSTIVIPGKVVGEDLIHHYHETRDFPAIPGTSRLGIHFRFGTISIREKARSALRLNGSYLNELIWRDFYSMILQHFPHVAVGPFKPSYAQICWRNHEGEFSAWCAGKTGYPMVDAGMRELAETGFMHNRVRMITASFLTKHLLIDWRWGEQWFAEKLLDYDLASNNGGWQWAAGCGTDAAPYFRIFNPASQMQKFDPQRAYVNRWVPEYGTADYPQPIVDHTFARERCLKAYQSALTR